MCRRSSNLRNFRCSYRPQNAGTIRSPATLKSGTRGILQDCTGHVSSGLTCEISSVNSTIFKGSALRLRHSRTHIERPMASQRPATGPVGRGQLRGEPASPEGPARRPLACRVRSKGQAIQRPRASRTIQRHVCTCCTCASVGSRYLFVSGNAATDAQHSARADSARGAKDPVATLQPKSPASSGSPANTWVRRPPILRLLVSRHTWVEPGRAKLSTAKLRGRQAGTGRAEPSRAGLSRAGLGWARPGLVKPGPAGLGQAKPGQARPGQAEPAQADPGGAKRSGARPRRVEPSQAGPSQSETRMVERQASRQAGPGRDTRARLGRARPVEAGLGSADSGKPRPGVSEALVAYSKA